MPTLPCARKPTDTSYDETLETSAIKLKNTDAYINTLPVEILAHIFHLCILQPQSGIDFHGYLYHITSHLGPINLTRVCKNWKEVALSTSSLWAYICPSLDPIDKLKYWLEISPKVPLHLEFLHHSSEAPRFKAGHQQQVFNLFARHAYRWRSLSIEPDPKIAEDFIDLLQSAANIPLPLEALSITFTEHAIEPTRSTIEILLSLLLSLKSLQRLNWIHPRGNILPNDIPWSQLKTIILSIPPSFETFFAYLSQCTSANTVEFRRNQLWKTRKPLVPNTHFPLVTLDNLMSLTLPKGCDPIQLLRYFTLPSLRSLEIQLYLRDQGELECFLKRSPCLQTLVIDEQRHGRCYHSESKISDQEVIDYLTSPYLRSIPRVGIQFENSKERVLDIIRNRSDSSTLFPRLCYLVQPLKMLRLVGWCDAVDDESELLLFSYEDGSLKFTEDYEHDAGF